MELHGDVAPCGRDCHEGKKLGRNHKDKRRGCVHCRNKIRMPHDFHKDGAAPRALRLLSLMQLLNLDREIAVGADYEM